MNFAMWKKALTVIPNVSKEEWDKLGYYFEMADQHPCRRIGDDLSLGSTCRVFLPGMMVSR